MTGSFGIILDANLNAADLLPINVTKSGAGSLSFRRGDDYRQYLGKILRHLHTLYRVQL